MKKFIATLMSLCLMAGILAIPSFAASGTLDSATAAAIAVTNDNDNSLVAQKGTPVIDAEIDDIWYTAQWYKAGDNYQDELNNGQTLHNTTYFAVLWDDANFYVMVYTTGFESYGTANDELRLGFHVGRSESDTGTWNTRNVWAIDYSLASKAITWQNWYDSKSAPFDEIVADKKISDTTGIVEFQYPVNAIFSSDGDGWTNEIGDKLGLAAIWADGNADNPGNRTFLYFNTDGYYSSPADYMTFTLADSSLDSGDDNANTSDIISVAVLLGTVALAGVVFASRKKNH